MSMDKIENFRFRVMEELNSRYNLLVLDSDKRERVLLNSINQFDDKLEQIKIYIDGQS